MAIGGKLTDWRHGLQATPTSLTDFTAKTKSLSYPMESEEVEQTVFGSGFREYESSFKSGTIEATYKYDATVWGQLTDIYSNQTEVDFSIAPDGLTSGKPKITGSMVLLSLSAPASVGEALDIETSWRMSGEFTFGTV